MNVIVDRLERLRPSLLAEPGAATAFTNQLTLAGTEWLPREQQEQNQLAHLRAMVRFAAAEVPFWRDRLDVMKVDKACSLTDALSLIPVLTREELRERGAALRAARLPQGHRQTQVAPSSGSTG